MQRKWIRKIPVVLAVATIGLFGFGAVVMLLWNSILPPVIHVGAITFWQALGILVLSKLLFGSFRGRRFIGGWHGKKQLFGKWQNMTAEEKEMFASHAGCGNYFAGRQCC